MDKLQSMANALAASIPPYNGRPTIPPVSWAQDGETVIVILADGRKIRASIHDINALMFPVGASGVRPDLDKVEVDISKPPAKKPTIKGGGKKK